jgi:hypothetical protein
LIGSLDEHAGVTDDAGELAGGGWFVGTVTVTTWRPSGREPVMNAGLGSAR